VTRVEEPEGVSTYLTYDSIADKLSPEARAKRMEMYAEWLALPSEMREPSTKKAVAEKLGVTYDTLKDYEADPRFHRLYTDRLNQEFKVERLGDVLNTLMQQATDPLSTRSVQAARLLLEWMEKRDQFDTDTVLSQLSLDEIRTELERRAT
jgi:hypothetical protein